MEENEIITCGCCGRGLRNNATENTHYGESPYPDDEGFGMCVECGGDRNSTDTRARLGWAGQMFYDARIEALREKLGSDNKARFEAMSYERKIAIITRLIEKGVMI